MGSHTNTVTLEFCQNPGGYRSYGRKREEYMADFCLVSRRTLNDADYTIFRYHYLLGADWKLCCRRTNTDKGDFFHNVYRIQERLGRVFAELQPYPLFPPDDYFATVIRRRGAALQAFQEQFRLTA